MKQEIDLLDQIIEIERHRDAELDKYYTLLHQSFRTVGESSCIHHLKTLREMLVAQDKILGNIIRPNYNGQIELSKINVRQGCIGRRYCHTCHIVWSDTCLCMPVPCPICNGNCPSESSDNTDNWERKNRSNFVVQSKGI
jgi:hypothetical protein